jgi:hypothetical protein
MTTERDPLLRGNSEEQYYTKSGIDVKHLDEEHASSSSSDEEEHDAEYIVKNRLGDTTLTMVALW